LTWLMYVSRLHASYAVLATLDFFFTPEQTRLLLPALYPLRTLGHP
jgi:hypothetical protein